MAKLPKKADPEVYIDSEPVIGTRVFPYRGIETHGVDPRDRPDVNPDAADYGVTVAVPIMPPEKSPDPVPVVIVQEDTGPGALKTWRVIREYVRAGIPRRILGQDETRTSTKIKNMHASDSLYVGPDSFVVANLGYPVAAGAELSLDDTATSVWALTGSTNDIDVAILVEFTVSGG